MKASILILLTVGLSFFLCSFSESHLETYSLTVKVEKLQNSKGVVQFETDHRFSTSHDYKVAK